MLMLLALLLTVGMFFLKLLGIIAVTWLMVFTPVLLWMGWVALFLIGILAVAILAGR